MINISKPNSESLSNSTEVGMSASRSAPFAEDKELSEAWEVYLREVTEASNIRHSQELQAQKVYNNKVKKARTKYLKVLEEGNERK